MGGALPLWWHIQRQRVNQSASILKFKRTEHKTIKLSWRQLKDCVASTHFQYSTSSTTHFIECRNEKARGGKQRRPAGITDAKYFPYWSVHLELIKAVLPRRHCRVNRSRYQSKVLHSQGLEYKTAAAAGPGLKKTLLWSEKSWWSNATQDRKQNH